MLDLLILNLCLLCGFLILYNLLTLAISKERRRRIWKTSDLSLLAAMHRPIVVHWLVWSFESPVFCLLIVIGGVATEYTACNGIWICVYFYRYECFSFLSDMDNNQSNRYFFRYHYFFFLHLFDMFRYFALFMMLTWCYR